MYLIIYTIIIEIVIIIDCFIKHYYYLILFPVKIFCLISYGQFGRLSQKQIILQSLSLSTCTLSSVEHIASGKDSQFYYRGCVQS